VIANALALVSLNLLPVPVINAVVDIVVRSVVGTEYAPVYNSVPGWILRLLIYPLNALAETVAAIPPIVGDE
jgi:hypothetical protein